MKIVSLCYNNLPCNSVWQPWTKQVLAFIKNSVDYYPGILFQFISNCQCITYRDALFRLKIFNEGVHVDEILVTKTNFEFIAFKGSPLKFAYLNSPFKDRFLEHINKLYSPHTQGFEFVLPVPALIEPLIRQGLRTKNSRCSLTDAQKFFRYHEEENHCPIRSACP